MNQIKSTNSSPPMYRGEAPSAAHTTGETNEATYPALDPTHALMHLPNLFHVPVATGDAQEQANKWVVLMLVALGAFMTTLAACRRERTDSHAGHSGSACVVHGTGTSARTVCD